MPTPLLVAQQIFAGLHDKCQPRVNGLGSLLGLLLLDHNYECLTVKGVWKLGSLVTV